MDVKLHDRLVDWLYAEAIRQDIPMHELSKKSIARATKAYNEAHREQEPDPDPE